jgi:hypothetical protein
MAETLPEPPPFDADAAWASITATGTQTVEEPAAVEAAVETAAEPEASQPVEAVAEPVAGYEAPVAEYEAPVAEGSQVDAPVAEPVATDTGDLFGIAPGASEDAPAVDADPRPTAIGIEPDFAAAEAEAAAFPAETPAAEGDIPTIAEDALAARLAGLVAEEPAPTENATTRVVVTGLVSVASIAGFKRNLARVSGVRSVGVSSGPDGEFVFAVTHDSGLALADGITSLPGFSARVTNEAPGELTVAARDPESES